MLAVIVIENILCLQYVNNIPPVFYKLLDTVEQIDEITGYIILSSLNLNTETVKNIESKTKKNVYYIPSNYLGNVYTNNKYFIINANKYCVKGDAEKTLVNTNTHLNSNKNIYTDKYIGRYIIDSDTVFNSGITRDMSFQEQIDLIYNTDGNAENCTTITKTNCLCYDINNTNDYISLLTKLTINDFLSKTK